MVFIDTNILFYAADTADRDKHFRATEALQEVRKRSTAVISSQVVCELAANLGRKLKMPAPEVADVVGSLRNIAFIGLTIEIVERALGIHQTHQLSFWDSCIVAAALEAGCEAVLTEDLQHGQSIEGIKIVNPFLS